MQTADEPKRFLSLLLSNTNVRRCGERLSIRLNWTGEEKEKKKVGKKERKKKTSEWRALLGKNRTAKSY